MYCKTGEVIAKSFIAIEYQIMVKIKFEEYRKVTVVTLETGLCHKCLVCYIINIEVVCSVVINTLLFCVS